MSDNSNALYERIIQDMSEGVMIVSMKGVITLVNPAAAAILGKSDDSLSGKRLAECFFEYEENDAFTESLLNAIHYKGVSHRQYVTYYTGNEVKNLYVTSSYMNKGEERLGLIAVISDVSELAELRDAVAAMRQIRQLNDQLTLRNRLLSETFGRFLSDEIVAQLLDTPDGLALGGRKMNLTVLMSDLRGFTALSEQMEAEDLLAMLNHYLGEMTEIIQSCGGTIIEFIGDGILAIFGAPSPSPNHADEAAAAAVRMQAGMAQVNDWNAEHGYPMLEMGIGINTGDVIVGNIGSEKRTKYGVTGKEVNLCGRIESFTIGGQILISDTAYSACRTELQTAASFAVRPKGADSPITLYDLTGIGAPYELSCVRSFAPPPELESPIAVSCCKIYSKQVSAEEFSGEITAMSDSEAVLQTAEPLSLFDNLQLSRGNEKSFAKLIKIMPDGNYLLRFTFRSSVKGKS